MAKTFYTEHDIEDMFKSGVTRLELSDNVVLTGLAYEKAQKLGMQLVQPNDHPSDAPVRPYISQVTSPAPTSYQLPPMQVPFVGSAAPAPGGSYSTDKECGHRQARYPGRPGTYWIPLSDECWTR